MVLSQMMKTQEQRKRDSTFISSVSYGQQALVKVLLVFPFLWERGGKSPLLDFQTKSLPSVNKFTSLQWSAAVQA